MSAEPIYKTETRHAPPFSHAPTVCPSCTGTGLAGDGCRCHGGTACTTCGGTGNNQPSGAAGDGEAPPHRMNKRGDT